MMPEGEKEPMTAETFDEDDYKSKLIDQDYSETTAAMLAAKKKEELAGKATKVEIDISKL